MVFALPHKARNIVLPIHLKVSLNSIPAPGVQNASVMMISGIKKEMNQDFIPLEIKKSGHAGYKGIKWEIFLSRKQDNPCLAFLGIPDEFVTALTPGKAVSLEIMGSSVRNGSLDFHSNLDIQVVSEPDEGLLSRFFSLTDYFFPNPLPGNFIEDFGVLPLGPDEPGSLLLKIDLRLQKFPVLPLGLSKTWDPSDWNNCNVGFLNPEDGNNSMNGFIEGGCFFSRNRRISHWFGDPEISREKEFRLQIAQKISDMGRSRNGSWIFWVRLPGSTVVDPFYHSPNVILRHSGIHSVLQQTLATEYLQQPSGMEQGKFWFDALREAAQIIIKFQNCHPFYPADILSSSGRRFRKEVELFFEKHGTAVATLEQWVTGLKDSEEIPVKNPVLRLFGKSPLQKPKEIAQT